MTELEPPQSTPLAVVANVSRVVSKVVDRLMSDRGEYPLMVAGAVVEALKLHRIESRIMYGPAAWVEVMDDHSVLWAGCWGKHFHFWVATQFGEVIDLNTSIAHRKPPHDRNAKPMLSPPMLWATEVPKFYRYQPEGIAELDLTEEKDLQRYAAALREISEKCGPVQIAHTEPEFANEPILCSGRKLLDDSNQTFKQYDRALAVKGIPPSPFDL